MKSPVDTVVAKELRDCAEIKASGRNTSGVYSIHPDGAKYPFNVYCDMGTDGGGWTVRECMPFFYKDATSEIYNVIGVALFC